MAAAGLEVLEVVGEGPQLGLPLLKVAEGVTDELGLASVDSIGDPLLSVAERVGAELVEERLESQRHDGQLEVVAEDEVGEEGERGAEPFGIGGAELGGDAGRAHGGGGRKNQVTGSSKARAKATISSASKFRMRVPSTDRSAAE